MFYPSASRCFKFSTLIFLCSVGFVNTHAQVVPTTASGVAVSTGNAYIPTGYGTTPVNLVAVFTPQQAGFTTETAVRSTSNTVAQVNITTQYVDGLGRPLQTVDWQGTPSKTDLVAPITYNQFGQEEYKFLPFTSGSTGNFRANAFAEQNTYYSTTLPSTEPAYTNEKYYYSHTNFEPSPLNRVTKTFAPGNAWSGSEGGASEKSVSVQYLVNNADDHVRIWTIGFDPVSDANNIPTSTTTSTATQEYDPGTLSKMVTIDEQGNAVIEFKDLEGHVILKKVQAGTVANFNTSTGFLCTYYVYDNLGQLRFVIPPKVVANISTTSVNWVISTSVANELCFRYEYDERQRVKAKKVPGADWIYMVYDSRDRLVYTQDGNLRGKSQWTYALYDALNRPVQAGIMDYSGTWANLITAAANTSNAAFTANDAGTYGNNRVSDLVVSKRNLGIPQYSATSSVVFSDGFTTENGASFSTDIGPGSASNFSTAPDVILNPLPSTGYTLYPQTYSYYDDYTFGSSKIYTKKYNGQLNNGVGNIKATLEDLPDVSTTLTTGMVTGTRIKVLEDPANLAQGVWMETVIFYDGKGRPIQTQGDNYKGGNDFTITRYNFVNNIVENLVVHENPQAGYKSTSSVTVYSGNLYDHKQRVTKIHKRVTYQSISYTRILAQNTYNALGQLKNKKIGQKSATDPTPLENDDYNYNIRGWLKGINWFNTTTYASQVSTANNKWFAFDLSYDWGMSTNLFNGNIAGMRWKSAGDAKERAYGYTYDQANRLLSADFRQNNGGWATDLILNFDVKMGNGTSATAYDENGNIKMMQQWGLVGLTSTQIDKLTYNYVSTANTVTLSNRLFAATEDPSINTTQNNVGDFTDKNRSGDDYTYDVNGNLTADKNKKITAITYNQLNLPYQITINNDNNTAKGTITYIYDAAGNKLEKRVNELASSFNNNIAKQTQTTYIGPFNYENNTLQFISTEEGRTRLKQTVSNTGTGQNNFVFDYFIKDHLGNVRVGLTDEVQKDYYPAATVEGTITNSNDAIYREKDYYLITTNTPNTNTGIVVPNPSNIPVYTNNNGIYNNNPNSNTSANSQKVYKLTGSSSAPAAGLNITLKVMSGDVIDIFGKAYWNQGITSTSSNKDLGLSSIIAGLLATPDGLAVSHGATQTALTTGVTKSAIPNVFLQRPIPANDPTTPMAYVNYILFDERFQYIASGAQKVDADGFSEDLHLYLKNIKVTANGFLYVYCSNQSPVDVFFDNLQVVLTHGPLIEENHYYPFGLTMSGISSQSLNFGGSENKKLYNGIEHTTDLDLNQYDAFFRTLDPQLGRWWQIDPKPNESISLYSSMENNPCLKFDALGDTAWKPTNTWNNDMINKFQSFIQQKVEAYINNGNEYTCEDFGLSTLIDFASENNLPVSIQNGSGTFSSNSNDFDNASDYKNAVLKTTGANDLLRDNNTTQADPKNLQAGDLLVLRHSNGQGHHVQVVTSASDKTINVEQGNSGIANIIPGSSRIFGTGNPRSPFYTGTQVQTGAYNLANGTYTRTDYLRMGNLQMTGSGEWAPTGTKYTVPVQAAPQSTASYNLAYRTWNFKNFK